MTKTNQMYLSVKKASEYLDIAVETLKYWRQKHMGPGYCKCNSLVRYPVKELDKFMAENFVRTRRSLYD